ncbi:FAD-dependent oxidoreductase [Streptomyces sp. NPDC001816]|uniref:FAD-dependent oxidoreductase n=1 Tax=Streptomyces sp. NPDC001816 TaxID=3364612 RepID=UPI0036B5BDC4
MGHGSFLFPLRGVRSVSTSDHSLLGHTLYRRPALDGRLHWASTETATDHAGHIEGALAAGERAAHAVLAATDVRPDPAVRAVRPGRRSVRGVRPGPLPGPGAVRPAWPAGGRCGS